MTPFAARLLDFIARDVIRTHLQLCDDFARLAKHDDTIPQPVGKVVLDAINELLALGRLESTPEGLKWVAPKEAVGQGKLF